MEQHDDMAITAFAISHCAPLDVIRYLLKHKICLNDPHAGHQSPLHAAVFRANWTVALGLMEHGVIPDWSNDALANLMVKRYDDAFDTILDVEVARERFIVQLLERGYNIDYSNPSRNNLMSYGRRSFRRLRFLLTCGATIDATIPTITCGFGCVFACPRAPHTQNGDTAMCMRCIPIRSCENERHKRKFIIEQRVMNTTRLGWIRDKSVSICIALQSLDLPAFVTLQIIDHSWDVLADMVPMYFKWKLITIVKHFNDKKELNS
jgi:hypothetical protein